MRSTFFIIISVLITLVQSCKIQGDEDVGLALPVDKDRFEIQYTDTLTVHTSTVLLDSIETTMNGYIIAGQYTSAKVGIVKASSFFSTGLDESAPAFSEHAVFDSLVLLLDYDPYLQGDTTQRQTYTVHRLTQQLAENKNYYGFDQAAYESNPVGSKQFEPRPNTKKPLQIRLTDQVGKELFEKAKAKQISTTTDLKTYFKGLALIPGADDNGAILRFKAESDSTLLRLYYHENKAELEKYTYDFRLKSGGTYFNHFTADRSQTLLAGLQQTFQSVKADATQEETYIQGGVGLHTRIDIPYVRNLKMLGNFAINKAELVIRPVAGTYTAAALPLVLGLQEVNGSNWRIGSDEQQPVYRKIEPVNNTYYYSYDLTSYINALLKENNPSKKGLLLSLPISSHQNSVQSVVLGSGKNRSYALKLNLYYTWVQ